MARSKAPVTAAVRALRAAGITYSEHRYRYEERSGAAGGATALGFDPHAVVKTLVMEDDTGDGLVVLMHGDREVSTKRLARRLGTRTVAPCTPEQAQRLSGYVVGGTSPFGLRRRLPIYVERSVLALETIYVNGGTRGFLVGISPADLTAALTPTPVDVAID